MALALRGETVKLVVRGIPTEHVRQLQAGGLDANGQAPLRRVAQGMSNPCRHCLQSIEEGSDMLVLSYRPFEQAQPYAESGPIFLHADHCPGYDAQELPAWFVYLEPAIVRGYGHDHWIRYETGQVVAGRDLTAVCQKILMDPEVAYVHIRSKFNCFQCRVDRA
jgi:hypothetical protein